MVDICFSSAGLNFYQSPLLLSLHPSSASCAWTELCTSPTPHPIFPLHFNSLLIFSFLSPSPALIQRHLLLSTSQTNYPTNWLSLRLSQTLLKSFRFHLIAFAVYLVFIWHLQQMVHQLRNTFIHVSVNMSEVLCTCWGWIQFCLSQRNRTDPLCRGGEFFIRCKQNTLLLSFQWAMGISLCFDEDFYLRAITERTWSHSHTM